ncbi:TonB-dependent receptor [Fulvivirgaceae bacterium BMA10]|uniref:TonB-dependent receptor n=1 Tax=Splendidivirga corallicola TaxID=3051826 RepID=A0ABT8KSI9_9BACT|nr:TonB-dependent receptor [Fulvivirgaceae bacterium BMA10]
MRNIYLSLLLTALALPAFSQEKYTLEGAVMDTTNVPLTSATIMLLQSSDSVMHSFTISDTAGKFTFNKVPLGNYILQISYLGLRNMSKPVKVEGTQPLIDLGQIVLKSETKILEEVAVSAERIPIVIKEDTIEYNADAFKTQANATVEDLLKKLPGVEVSKDGTIKAQGEDVKKVLVDGKEFFGNDPKIATKNLPADAVNKVQVFDKMSEMTEFTGVDDGERDKTINLALKEDKKKGYFGKISGGYGSDDRYVGKANINRFTKRLQFSALASFNNVNQQNFSIGDYINFMGGLEGMSSGGGVMSFSMADGGFGRGGSSGITTSWSAGLNFNYDPSKSTEVSASYFYNRLKNDLEQDVFRRNFLDGQNFNSENTTIQESDNTNHRLNLKVKHKFSETQDISIRSRIKFNDGLINRLNTSKTFNTEDVLENEGTNNNHSIGEDFSLFGNLIYRKKFSKKGRSFVTNFSVNKNDKNKLLDLISSNTFLPNDPALRFTEVLNQNQDQRDDQFDYKAKVSYTEPIGKRKYLQFSYTYQNYNNELVKDFYDILGDGGRLLNDELSSFYERDYRYHRGGSKFVVNKKSSNFTLGVDFQQSTLKGQVINSEIEIKKNFTNLLPNARYKIDLASSQHLTFNYSTGVREPSLNQLQPIVDNSNPLRTYIGNPDLKAEYTHRFSVHYMLFDQFNFTNLFFNLNARYSKNKITNSSTIDEFFRQTIRPVNVDNDISIGGYASFGTPLRFMGSKIGLNLNSRYSRGILFVNDVENNTSRWTNSVDFSLGNRKKEIIDVKAGVRFSFNNTRYSVNKDLNQNFLNKVYYADATLEFLESWAIGSSFNFTIYDSEAFNDNLEVPIWQAHVTKNFLKNDRGQLKLAIKDILNQNRGINRSSQFNYIQDERVNALGRYFLLSFSYSLSAFGGDDTFIIRK